MSRERSKVIRRRENKVDSVRRETIEQQYFGSSAEIQQKNKERGVASNEMSLCRCKATVASRAYKWRQEVWQKARKQWNQANEMRHQRGELRKENSRRIWRRSPFNGSPKRPGGLGSMAGREGKEASDETQATAKRKLRQRTLTISCCGQRAGGIGGPGGQRGMGPRPVIGLDTGATIDQTSGHLAPRIACRSFA